jgi:hypothetical protein
VSILRRIGVDFHRAQCQGPTNPSAGANLSGVIPLIKHVEVAYSPRGLLRTTENQPFSSREHAIRSCRQSAGRNLSDTKITEIVNFYQ